MKKAYIKPAIELFSFDHTESLLANSPNFGLDEDKDKIKDEEEVWTNKRDWSNTSSKDFWK
jgi:hypothetical protein